MEKLLHERLRDDAELNEIFTMLDNGCKRVFLNVQERNDLADEIEKYYIPRPRFEDGEPVQFGDTFKDFVGQCYVFMIFDNGMVHMGTHDDNKMYVLLKDEFAERPKTKVLDVDGVEIKEGDTVWHIEGSSPWQVESADVRGVKVFGNNIANISGSTVFHPSHLTHKEPDSLEKIENDATTNPHVYCREHFDFDGSEDLEEVVSRFAVDLLERQRKVLYRGE